MKYLTLRNSIYVAIVVYVCSFVLSFCVNKNEIINIEVDTKNERIITKEDQYLTSPNAIERFKHISINNENVVILNYIGALSLGFSSLIQIAFNGFTFGSYVGVYSNYMPFKIILKYTLPHSFELVAIIFSGGEGLYLGVSFILCLFGYKNIKEYNFIKVAFHFMLYTVIIGLAAFVEAYITMSL